MSRLTRLSRWAILNVIGLVLTAAGMVTQIAGGSELYPTLTGPIILLASALLVASRPGSWTRWIGLGVPVVLGIGAIVAAAMTGEFIEQLNNGANILIVVGSLMHVTGLVAAVGGGLGVVIDRHEAVTVEQ